MDKTQELLANEPISKLLVRYSIPAIIGMLVNALYNVVDRMFIGNIPNVGKLATAGIGVTMPITTILIAFGMLVGIGAITNISIKLGEGKIEEADRVLGNSITLSIIIGIVLTFIGIIFGEKILILFGASEQSLPYAQPFVNIILLGAVFNIAAFTLNSTIRGDGNPKLAAIIMSVGCILNIFLDYIFIFKFNMGIEGAAIATVIAQVITAIWGIMYYIKGKSNLKLKREYLKLDLKTVEMICAIGMAAFSMQIAASVVQIVCNNALKLYGGDLAIGAMSTITSIMLVFFMPVFGISQGSQPIIGFNYGKKQYDRVKKTFNISLVYGIVILTVGWVVINIWPSILVKAFNSDKDLVSVTINGLKKYSLMMTLVPISILGSNYIQSVGKAKKAIILGLLRQVIILIPVTIILSKLIGLDGVWYAQPVSDFIAIVITWIIVVKEMRSYKVYNKDLQSKFEVEAYKLHK
ncbi:mate efflux family protein [[Clostridium] sordellii]|uniref:MATE family efflux transporter n=1 Tax=Paraclostridium sordellii TaxID=1505 RepID=UPI0005DB8AC1|nr:MATE family efflux transporter [Paeniclostridium sordellii]MBX9182293.1 MATE family efflux transporter [Paeniclostridium sordellii]CEO15825.1 mate efflux family protein [[Clostridium] sordellii] [Paeniclostridium sordellii]CEP85271.1 mate efflux family protein [[Clostridium] sordellii] [Paeniclostridium sordellii]